MSQLRETSKRKKRLCAFTAACDCCHVVIPLSVCPPGRDLRKNSLTHYLEGHGLEIHSGPAEWGRKPRPSSSTSFRAGLTVLFREWEDSRFQPCLHRGRVFSCLKFCEWRHVENRNTKNNINCYTSIQVLGQRYHNTITQIHFHE